MKGTQGIPSLQLETLNKLISKMPKAPTMHFSNQMPAVNYPSDKILWEVEYGSAGMTPFVAPGAPAPRVGIDGNGQGNASVAYFKEKIFFDEEFLNNLRKVGSWSEKETKERQIARAVQKLNYRADRRREWMAAKALIDGGFTYLKNNGQRFTISYGVPSTHIVTLATNDKWGTGNSSDPVDDIFSARLTLSNDIGMTPEQMTCICNSNVLRLLMKDSGIRTLLQKSQFGDGDLFKNPSAVLGSLLGVGNITIYDDLYEVTAWLTGNVTGGSTTAIPVDDPTDFEVGGVLRFFKLNAVNVWEDRTITAVSQANLTVTVDSAPTNSYTAGVDKIVMKKRYVKDNVFYMYTPTYEGQPVCEMMQSPFGLNGTYGKYMDTNEEWDPDGIMLRVQDKALPVNYHPDCSFTLYVQ